MKGLCLVQLVVKQHETGTAIVVEPLPPVVGRHLLNHHVLREVSARAAARCRRKVPTPPSNGAPAVAELNARLCVPHRHGKLCDFMMGEWRCSLVVPSLPGSHECRELS